MLPATAGYMFTYWNSKASKEREAQIDRVNAQVRRLRQCSAGAISVQSNAAPLMGASPSDAESRRTSVTR
jgi:hypothetical protein